MLIRWRQQWQLMLLAILASWASAATAQVGNIPDQSYYPAVDELYTGDYRRALRSMQRESQGSVKTATARWVDSICYRARLGEISYQMGQNAAALEHFDVALQLFLAYPDWLLQVKFSAAPRPLPNPQRMLAPWGKSPRQVVYGGVTGTQLVSQGKFTTTDDLKRGGVISQPQFWRVDVVEIIRCAAIAIHRRNELLGPLAAHDQLSRDVADRLARGGLAPPNHWSNAWIELLLGLAQQGVGKTEEALSAFNRAILLDGQFDHNLTALAFLAQGQIAFEAGNLAAAGNLFAEAGYAAYAFHDLYSLDEALRWGFLTHATSGADGVYPPLPTAATWAQRTGLHQLVATAQLGVADSLAGSGQSKAAGTALAAVGARARDVLAGRIGAQTLRLQAQVAYQQAGRSAGDPLVTQAIGRQRELSLRNFQLALANTRYDSGALSPRQAANVYEQLLADPRTSDWTRDPLDAMAVLATDHAAAIDRHFTAVMQRRETLRAIDITELAKRRRFQRSDPFAGRLVGLRMLLTAPEAQLPEAARLERQSIRQRVPRFGELSDAATKLNAEIFADATLLATPKLTGEQAKKLEELDRLSQEQELLLRQVALLRQGATLVFPPPISAEEVQRQIRPGQAMVIFHESSTGTYGFLLVKDDYHTWELAEDRELRKAVTGFHQGIGNHTRTRTLKSEEAAGETWGELARSLGDVVLGNSRLDLPATKELVIVPDGLLWHVPFETLQVTDSQGSQLVFDHTPVRYAPTASLALSDSNGLRPAKRSVAVLATSGGKQEEAVRTERWERLAEALPSPVRLEAALSSPMPVALSGVNQVVSMYDADLKKEAPYALDYLGLDRGAEGSLTRWMEQPSAAPERLILAGVHTAAENGLKSNRRATRGEVLRDGDEVFHALCGLMASGARTVLMSRWTTSGQTADDLVREFAQEMGNLPPSEAWRRSVLLARSATLDPAAEPRLKPLASSEDPPTASHPLFWAGYLLVDNSPAAEEVEEEKVENEEVKKEEGGGDR